MSIFKEEHPHPSLYPNPLRGAKRFMPKPSFKQWAAFALTLTVFLSLYHRIETDQPVIPPVNPITAFEKSLKEPGLTDQQGKAIIKLMLEKWPKSEEAHLIASQYFIKKLNYTEALTVLSWQPEPFSKHIEYYGMLAFVHLQMQHPKQALTLYQSLSQIDPKNPKWWLGLGTSHDLINQPEQAQLAWKKAKYLARPSASYYSIIEERLTHFGEIT